MQAEILTTRSQQVRLRHENCGINLLLCCFSGVLIAAHRQISTHDPIVLFQRITVSGSRS
jgi:hypothetical protein